ncbi:MAG: glycosyltransferase family 4 protein [Solirubrobacteraceae bacterium]
MARFCLSFGAWADGISGGDRHLLEMAARWRDEVTIEVVAPPQAREAVASFVPGAEFVAAGSGARWVNERGPFLAAEYLRRAVAAQLARRRPDVVVAASHFLPDAATLTAAVRRGSRGVAYVYHLMEGRMDRSPRTLWSKVDERASLALLRRHASVVFTSNRETSDILGKRGFPVSPTDVGIDVASFQRARPESAPPVVVFVARLVRSKGLTDAIEAVALTRRDVPDARLIVVGSGPERAAGERRAAALGITDAVQWTGFVSETEKRRVMASARAFLAPSYEEGWGIAVAEALASGLPVIGYRLPILDEIFGDAYRGVQLGSVEALAAATRHLLQDDAAALRASAAGQAAVARYDLGQIARHELGIIMTAGASAAGANFADSTVRAR